jgi:hypothetical protein
MPGPKVFVSSTCYDLAMARDQLRSFLLGLGYEPILSEYSDVLFDPRVHTHTSCLQGVSDADLIVLIIGSRFGGKAIPEALSSVAIDQLIGSSFDVQALENPEALSVTQLEVLKAIDCEIPVFAFVGEKVWHDHLVYERNKEMAEKIKFPSIDKPETAKFIFEFINFLRQRVKGNALISFARVEDIENHLRKQWSSYFQRLLREQREGAIEVKRAFGLSEQLEDLKAAVLSSIDNAQSREIARGVIKYRRLVDFLIGLRLPDPKWLVNREDSLEDIYKEIGIVKLVDFDDPRQHFGRSAFVKEDGTFYEIRYPSRFVSDISMDWQSFIGLSAESRQVIVDALAEDRRMGVTIVRYRDAQFDEYFDDKKTEEVSLEEPTEG